MLERRQKEQHVRKSRSLSHQADSPDAAGEWTEARTDLDVEFLQQLSSHSSFVDTCRNAHCVERPESLAFRRQQLETKRRETCGERVMIGAMARLPRREALILDHGQRLA